MKQGKSVINLVMIALAVVLAVYFGVYLFNSLNSPVTTTVVYEYTLNDSAQVNGLMVRQETVLPSQSGIVDVIRSEGERVGGGQPVAVVYRDSQAQEAQAELEALKLEADLLGYAMTQTGDVGSAARLDEDIIQSVVALRDSTGRNDYTELEELVVDVKSGVLKRGYTYGDDVTSAELTARRNELMDRIAALTRQTASGVSQITAPQPGTFSHVVDGMEDVITLENMSKQTPQQLHALMDQKPQPDQTAVGKLITSPRWYFSAVVPTQTAQRLDRGKSYIMRFTGDFTQDVDMRVESIGRDADGETAVVFSSDRYMDRTTLLRQQSAELIFSSSTGLRVPKTAVRMVKETYTDKETGEEIKENTLGVYVLVAGRTEFKPVETITEGSDYYVVRSPGNTPDALRAGDEIITEATGLYEGEDFRD